MNYKRTMYKRNGNYHNQKKNNSVMQTRQGCEKEQCVSYCTDGDYPSLAMVYGVNQCWKEIMDGNEGFVRGTIFCELYKPFRGDKCKNGGCAR